MGSKLIGKEQGELYVILEKMFKNEQYLDIVNCWEGNKYSVEDFKKYYIQILEILSIGYLETDNYKKSLFYIDLATKVFTQKFQNNLLTIDDEDDLKMFLLTKLEILQRKNSPVKEYLVFHKYDRLFADDIGFANRKKELLEIAENRFMSFIKRFGYILIVFIFLSVLSLIFKGEPIFPKVSTIFLFVYLILIIIRKGLIKQILNQLSRL